MSSWDSRQDSLTSVTTKWVTLVSSSLSLRVFSYFVTQHSTTKKKKKIHWVVKFLSILLFWYSSARRYLIFTETRDHFAKEKLLKDPSEKLREYRLNCSYSQRQNVHLENIRGPGNTSHSVSSPLFLITMLLSAFVVTKRECILSILSILEPTSISCQPQREASTENTTVCITISSPKHDFEKKKVALFAAYIQHAWLPVTKI